MAEIRALSADDWRQWRELRLRALQEDGFAFGSTYDEWVNAAEDQWRARLGLPESVNLIAVVDGVPVGMASGVMNHEPRVVELISMWIASESRGSAIADALISAVSEWARPRADEVRLDVVSTNSRAIAVYERNGFAVTDEARDREGCEIVMRKRIARTDSEE